MTTQQIIDAWDAQADDANKWGALGEDEKLTWAFKCASEKSEQEPDDLSIAYMAGLHRGKELSPQRTWVGLTDEDRQRAFESMPDMLDGFLKTWGWLHFAKAIEEIAKEKNT